MENREERYEAPTVEVLGQVEELTQQTDKIGSVPDAITPQVPILDGSIVPDP